MGKEYLADPKKAPPLNVPQSEVVVKLSIIDSTTHLDLKPMSNFVQPDYKGKESMTGPAFAFLIEHSSGKKLLFDLGVRKDWKNLPPAIANRLIEKGWIIEVQSNVADILQDSGLDLASIDGILLSHQHFDHTGDLETFPSSTEVIVGPGFLAAHLPGYPTNPESSLYAHDFEDRPVREVDIAKEGAGLKIGRFHAYDYFGDGSFYLLDTPGHSIGHMCGLARTTSSPPTFVFMGGDASHHGGEFRPSEYLPLPTEISPSPIKRFAPVCPGHLLQEVHGEKSATSPFYHVTESFAHDLDQANWTIAGLQEFDAADNVLLIVAHDESLVGQLGFFPSHTLNDWYEDGLAKKVHWRFLGDFEAGIENAK